MSKISVITDRMSPQLKEPGAVQQVLTLNAAGFPMAQITQKFQCCQRTVQRIIAHHSEAPTAILNGAVGNRRVAGVAGSNPRRMGDGGGDYEIAVINTPPRTFADACTVYDGLPDLVQARMRQHAAATKQRR